MSPLKLQSILLLAHAVAGLVSCGRKPVGPYGGRATLETKLFEGSKLVDKTTESFEGLKLKLDKVDGSHLTYSVTFENGPLAGCVIKAANRVPHPLRVDGSILTTQKCDVRYKRGVLKNVQMQGSLGIDLTEGGLGKLFFNPRFIAVTERKGYRTVTFEFQTAIE
jgi:hypothetical protein